MQPTMMPSMTWLKMSDRRARWVQVFARLKPGYTAESAVHWSYDSVQSQMSPSRAASLTGVPVTSTGSP